MPSQLRRLTSNQSHQRSETYRPSLDAGTSKSAGKYHIRYVDVWNTRHTLVSKGSDTVRDDIAIDGQRRLAFHWIVEWSNSSILNICRYVECIEVTSNQDWMIKDVCTYLIPWPGPHLIFLTTRLYVPIWIEMQSSPAELSQQRCQSVENETKQLCRTEQNNQKSMSKCQG